MLRWILCGALLAFPASAGTLEGVTSADEVSAGGKTLKLNGMGLRRKFIINVYVASLYVEAPSTDAAAILKADAVRRVELKMLRDLDKAAIVDAIRSGFEKNAGSKLAGLKDSLDKFCAVVPDVKKGATLVVQYVPGKGTSIEGGKDSYQAEGKDFADALFSVWIGQHPVDDGLKKGMLGAK